MRRKLASAVDFADIPNQWALDCVELKVKLANQSHLVNYVEQ
jgi:hypothetical protein